MGNAHVLYVQQSNNEPSRKDINWEQFRYFCEQYVSPTSSFFNALLDFSPITITSQDQSTHLLKEVTNLCQIIENKNPTTRNLNNLIQFIIELLHNISASSIQENYRILRNGLFVSRLFMLHLIQNSNLQAIPDLFTKGGALAENLVNSLVNFLIDHETNTLNYDSQMESLNLLIVLLSTQMFSPPTETKPNTNNKFFDIMLNNDSQPNRSKELTQKLITHFIKDTGRQIHQQQQQQQQQHHQQQQQSESHGIVPLLHTITNAASLLIFFPFRAYSYLFSSQSQHNVTDKQTDILTLSDNCLLLLLILVHRSDIQNPYRYSISNMSDPSIDRSMQNDKIYISFNFLYNSIISKHSVDDRTILLIYFLLHNNNSFRSFIISRSDLDLLLIPLLQVLYNAADQKPQQIYMVIIIMLILSQDSQFNKSIQQMNIQNVSWLRGRHITNISLGSLSVIVLVRTVIVNLSKIRDVYLHSNCLATLANIAPYLEGIHPYAAHRIVKLFDMLGKKYKKVLIQIDPSYKPPKPEHDIDIEVHVDELRSVESKQQSIETLPNDFYTFLYDSPELTTYSDFIHMILKIINSIITNSIDKNPHLIYALLYQQHLFDPFSSHDRFGDLVHNIKKAIYFFNSSLERARTPDWSAEMALAVIKGCSSSWKSDSLKPFIQIQFKYEEEENSEEFFTPYVWCVIIHYSVIHWETNKIKLFTFSESDVSSIDSININEDEVIDDDRDTPQSTPRDNLISTSKNENRSIESV